MEVHDFNVHETGMPYLVMELLDGEDLAERIRRTAPMPLAQVVRIVQQVALGLDAAHREGVVHRDLNPKNIFLCRRLEGGVDVDDFVKILDFGVSKCREMQDITRENAVIGTPNYMSPEQADGLAVDVDERTDIFALGVLTWEMLTGQRAFDAGTTTGTLYQVQNLDPAPVAQIRPDVPELVDVVLGSAMAKPKAQRYPSVLLFSQGSHARPRTRIRGRVRRRYLAPRPTRPTPFRSSSPTSAARRSASCLSTTARPCARSSRPGSASPVTRSPWRTTASTAPRRPRQTIPIW